ncbi:DUF6305 family protein [Jonquetella anthropi]|uniref:DUF6305 family protein n=1 Tax=Jonquetella anthropi TaxID=428712 RepID=UPI0003102062|nr:DUF6305 family protein [Jonquetella anthropi]
MKRILALSALAVMLMGSAAFAALSGADVPKGNDPLLITNAGQGPGGKMGRLLFTRAGVQGLTYNAEPKADDVEAGGFKTMVVVIGSSAKGLGASGITIDQEIDRLVPMLDRAKSLGIQIVAAHIEGKARRGKPGSADERSIDTVLPYADYIVVNKESDEDGRFTEFAHEHDIPITYLDSAMDLKAYAEAMYKK